MQTSSDPNPRIMVAQKKPRKKPQKEVGKEPKEKPHLSKELWDLIFDYGEKADFAAISLASKQLHELVAPYLYRELIWIPEVNEPFPPISNLQDLPEYRGMDLSIISPPPSSYLDEFIKPGPENSPIKPAPYLLLRTLLSRQDLASYVKHVKLLAVSRYIAAFWDPDEAVQDLLNAQETSLVEEMVAGLPKMQPHDWNTMLKAKRLDVMIALLFTLLPNLSSVDMRARYSDLANNVVFWGLRYTGARDWKDKMMFDPTLKCYPERVTTRTPIESITISLDNDLERRWPYKDAGSSDPLINPITLRGQLFQSLVWNFNLQHLTVPQLEDGIGRNLRGLDKKHHFLLANNLKSLSLPHSKLSADHLDSILLATPNLEELYVEIYFAPGAPSMYCNTPKLLTSLSRVAATLTRLKLVFHFPLYVDVDDVSLLVSPMYGEFTFKRFSKLKQLTVPLALLLPHTQEIPLSFLATILPASLESLSLSPAPAILDPERRVQACEGVNEYIAKHPHLVEDRRKHLFHEPSGEARNFGPKISAVEVLYHDPVNDGAVCETRVVEEGELGKSMSPPREER